MTNIKKNEKGKSGVKATKLRLHKETLKDLSVKKGASPKGGVGPAVCSWEESGCL